VTSVLVQPSDRLITIIGGSGFVGRHIVRALARRGYRIRVSDILSLLSAGASHAEILEDYPFLEEEDIFAALEYAAVQTQHPILIAA
jgi:uncharacterized protein (DUF433 family)